MKITGIDIPFEDLFGFVAKLWFASCLMAVTLGGMLCLISVILAIAASFVGLQLPFFLPSH
jgi:hypothetical protein